MYVCVPFQVEMEGADGLGYIPEARCLGFNLYCYVFTVWSSAIHLARPLFLQLQYQANNTVSQDCYKNYINLQLYLYNQKNVWTLGILKIKKSEKSKERYGGNYKKQNKIIQVVSWNKKADFAGNQKPFHCKKQKPLFNKVSPQGDTPQNKVAKMQSSETGKRIGRLGVKIFLSEILWTFVFGSFSLIDIFPSADQLCFGVFFTENYYPISSSVWLYSTQNN